VPQCFLVGCQLPSWLEYGYEIMPHLAADTFFFSGIFNNSLVESLTSLTYLHLHAFHTHGPLIFQEALHFVCSMRWCEFNTHTSRDIWRITHNFYFAYHIHVESGLFKISFLSREWDFCYKVIALDICKYQHSLSWSWIDRISLGTIKCTGKMRNVTFWFCIMCFLEEGEFHSDSQIFKSKVSPP
jgi:hypothetical protein